ncbi:uncharacterized protein LOC128961603 [Oppia nitens]|uniref:uncharacterized protein LOC128961603 n=1 Tax=Oppia nitens TaxID=1686743 RepID=UPI0023D9B8F1|nr:uncharacterized protein LOC128961603 [Oppia nitens]
MKERDTRNKYDPTGFNFQANIHGWPDYDGSDKANKIADSLNWHKCQHESYFFLIWHRMYIFFFERILRKTINSSDFALPYWDVYEKDSRSMPIQFRQPADSGNPLYVSERCANINEGNSISERLIDPYPALSTNFFTTHKQNNELNICHSFGGGRIDKPQFASDREGLLERIPHDNVHLFVGGPHGFMSDLCKSSRDPIFYLHHSNTDRIWESWMKAGGKNIIEPKYLNQTFDFYDETGKLKSYRVADFNVDSKSLGYTYDYLINADKVKPTRIDSPQLYVPIDEREGLNINYYKRYISLRVKPYWNDFFIKYLTGEMNGLDIKFTLQFDLDYLSPNIIFQIFLNLDENTYPVDTHPNFVGTMVTFAPKCVPRIKRETLDINKCYDISEQMYRILTNEYNFKGYIPDVFNLTFVPKYCDKTFYPKNTENLVSFFQILLVVHKEDDYYNHKNNTSNLLTDPLKDKEVIWSRTISAIPHYIPTPVIKKQNAFKTHKLKL